MDIPEKTEVLKKKPQSVQRSEVVKIRPSFAERNALCMPADSDAF